MNRIYILYMISSTRLLCLIMRRLVLVKNSNTGRFVADLASSRRHPPYLNALSCHIFRAAKDDKSEDTGDGSPSDRSKSQPDDGDRRKEKRKSKKSKKKSDRKKHRRSRETEGSSAAEKGSGDEGTSSEEDDEVRCLIHRECMHAFGRNICFVSCAHSTRRQ